MNTIQYTNPRKLTWDDINLVFHDCLTLLRTLSDILYLSTNDQCVLEVKIDDYKNLIRYIQDLKDLIREPLWVQYNPLKKLPCFQKVKLPQLEMIYLHEKLKDLLNKIKDNYDFW